MSFSVDVLTNIAIELQRGIGHQDRLQRLITVLRQMLEYDVSTLLRYDSWQFIPFIIGGPAKDVLGKRSALEGHPRLEAIVRADDVVCFPTDSELPDSYDSSIPGQESLEVHTCVGLPLLAGQDLVGTLTLDGMRPDQFDASSDEKPWLIAVLVAGTLSNVLLIEQLGSQNMLSGDAVPLEAVKQVQVINLSLGIIQLKEETEIVAVSDLNVLISGRTGAGKELVAKAVHEASLQMANPLVYLSCIALPESVAESKLSGHVKGTFTGAVSNHDGKPEMVDNGMLFFDEIGELLLALRVKLLRVLQHGDIQRVGDDRSLRVGVRALAAANRDLREEVLARRFRTDLFHRLSVFPLSAPPLRKRGDDAILLTGYFCEQCRLRLGLPRVILSIGARNSLQYYSFPGSVREPEHAIHRAVALSRVTRSGGEAILETQCFAFPEATLPSPEAAMVPAVKQSLREVTEAPQREAIRQVLVQNHHSWAAYARTLETNAANLHRLAKHLGLKD